MNFTRKMQLEHFCCEHLAMLDETEGRVEKVRRNGTVVMVSTTTNSQAPCCSPRSGIGWPIACRLIPTMH